MTNLYKYTSNLYKKFKKKKTKSEKMFIQVLAKAIRI